MPLPGSTCADSGIMEWRSIIQALPDIPTKVLSAHCRSCPPPCSRAAADIESDLKVAFFGKMASNSQP